MSIEVFLTSLGSLGMFLVGAKGCSNCRAVLRFDGDNGSAQASMEAGHFHCPFDLSPADAESLFALTLPPRSVGIHGACHRNLAHKLRSHFPTIGKEFP